MGAGWGGAWRCWCGNSGRGSSWHARFWRRADAISRGRSDAAHSSPPRPQPTRPRHHGLLHAFRHRGPRPHVSRGGSPRPAARRPGPMHRRQPPPFLSPPAPRPSLVARYASIARSGVSHWGGRRPGAPCAARSGAAKSCRARRGRARGARGRAASTRPPGARARVTAGLARRARARASANCRLRGRIGAGGAAAAPAPTLAPRPVPALSGGNYGPRARTRRGGVGAGARARREAGARGAGLPSDALSLTRPRSADAPAARQARTGRCLRPPRVRPVFRSPPRPLPSPSAPPLQVAAKAAPGQKPQKGRWASIDAGVDLSDDQQVCRRGRARGKEGGGGRRARGADPPPSPRLSRTSPAPAAWSTSSSRAGPARAPPTPCSRRRSTSPTRPGETRRRAGGGVDDDDGATPNILPSDPSLPLLCSLLAP